MDVTIPCPCPLKATGEPGRLVEVADTQKIFSNPSQKATEDYISGRFG